ncbi:MCM DNA helicase complex subunit [Boothiomyces sp. JEL0838]|nr:MCM DNA helicase complex subunit [Boothiomyces sp. JEL0838]
MNVDKYITGKGISNQQITFELPKTDKGKIQNAGAIKSELQSIKYKARNTERDTLEPVGKPPTKMRFVFLISRPKSAAQALLKKYAEIEQKMGKPNRCQSASMITNSKNSMLINAKAISPSTPKETVADYLEQWIDSGGKINPTQSSKSLDPIEYDILGYTIRSIKRSVASPSVRFQLDRPKRYQTIQSLKRPSFNTDIFVAEKETSNTETKDMMEAQYPGVLLARRQASKLEEKKESFLFIGGLTLTSPQQADKFSKQRPKSCSQINRTANYYNPHIPSDRKRDRDSLEPEDPNQAFDQLSEAAEDDRLEDDMFDTQPIPESDDDGEDLFGDNLDRDYREKEEEDNYELESVDNQEYDPISRDARLVAEHQMRRRDLASGRIAPGLAEDDDFLDEPMPVRRRRRDVYMEDIDVDDDEVAPLDQEGLRDVKGSLSDYVTMEAPSKTIKNEFHRFLTSFVNENGVSVYGERINKMCEAESQSLEVDYAHLCATNATLAFFLINAPAQILPLFDAVAMEVVLAGFENYERIHSEIHVRIANLPAVETLRDLRQIHLNTLVRVTGVVTKRSAVYPQLRLVKYDCVKCGAVIGPFYQDSNREIRAQRCNNCQSKGPFNLNSEETIYRNYQRLTLQESPGSVPAGRLPRNRDVILLWDLVDCARPGDEIELTGVYMNSFDASLNVSNGFPVFKTIFEANHIGKKEDSYSSFRLNEEDQRQIRTLARDPRIRKRIIKSIAPSIYGHEDIKTAIALSMFGGVFKNPQNKHKLRGDINVLLLGDPGTAKSQFLKYVEKTSHRAIYATGQGASAVGLTATVHKDPVTREWTLEGGALVMADKGVCLIDEFDKMNDQDRTSIHEAMEQQSISVSKAGIITTLQARCAVIAAANPLFGKYNPQVTFSQNVELTEPILSRFDILCVVKDIADPLVDEQLARFVINSHMKSHPNYDHEVEETIEEDADVIPQELLKKYIIYARDNIKPTMQSIDVEKLEKLYSELRRESMIGGSIPITVRYLESIIRMSEAFARMHLRDIVRQDDIDHAISVTIKSFISTQKHTVKKSLSKIFEKYMSLEKDDFELLNHIISEIKQEHMRYNYYQNDQMPDQVSFDVEELELRAKELNIHDLSAFFESPLFQRNFTLEGSTIQSRI